MVQSKETTVADYLESLPAERRAVLASVRKEIRAKLPKGYQETMSAGMISYEIPLSRHADTYNGKPLVVLALAAQKNNYALYAMSAYMDPSITTWLRGEFEKAGKKLDMGKSCIRFKGRDDLPDGVVSELAGKMTVEEYLRHYTRAKAK